jgi:hypothetical protein
MYFGKPNNETTNTSTTETTDKLTGSTNEIVVELSCDEHTKEVGCNAPSFINAVWGRTRLYKGHLAFTKQLSGKCQAPPNDEESDLIDLQMQGSQAGPFFVYNSSGYRDLHVFADPVTKNVVRLMLFPNGTNESVEVPKPIHIGLDEAAEHERRTMPGPAPGARKMIRMRITYLECEDGMSYLRDVQGFYLDENESTVSSSDSVPFNPSVPVIQEVYDKPTLDAEAKADAILEAEEIAAMEREEEKEEEVAFENTPLGQKEKVKEIERLRKQEELEAQAQLQELGQERVDNYIQNLETEELVQENAIADQQEVVQALEQEENLEIAIAEEDHHALVQEIMEANNDLKQEQEAVVQEYQQGLLELEMQATEVNQQMEADILAEEERRLQVLNELELRKLEEENALIQRLAEEEARHQARLSEIENNVQGLDVELENETVNENARYQESLTTLQFDIRDQEEAARMRAAEVEKRYQLALANLESIKQSRLEELANLSRLEYEEHERRKAELNMEQTEKEKQFEDAAIDQAEREQQMEAELAEKRENQIQELQAREAALENQLEANQAQIEDKKEEIEAEIDVLRQEFMEEKRKVEEQEAEVLAARAKLLALEQGEVVEIVEVDVLDRGQKTRGMIKRNGKGNENDKTCPSQSKEWGWTEYGMVAGVLLLVAWGYHKYKQSKNAMVVPGTEA